MDSAVNLFALLERNIQQSHKDSSRLSEGIFRFAQLVGVGKRKKRGGENILVEVQGFYTQIFSILPPISTFFV